MSEKIAGFGAVVWRDDVKVDNIRQFAFPSGTLKFEGATEGEAMPPPGIDLTFNFTVDYSAIKVGNGIWPEWLWRSMGRLRAMLARRERKRYRRWQRQKRKGG